MRQPLAADASYGTFKKISVDAMHEVLDLSYASVDIYNLEPDIEEVERFGYGFAKACKFNKILRMEVDDFLSRDRRVGKEPFILVEYSYLVRLSTVWLEEREKRIALGGV